MKESNVKTENTELTEKLVAKAKGGSPEAFCDLYSTCKDKLYRYALYRLGSPEEAEDAVSDCVTAAWQGIGSLKSENAFMPWIFSILSNCCNKHIKSEIRARESMQNLRESSNVADGTQYKLTAQSIELAEALEILSDEEREIVLMSVVGGLSSKEIADLTRLTAGSVRSKLSRSLSKMRDFLE